MKGQSINLNWVIGTIVFLTALVFSITYTFNSFNERESQAALQEELKDIRDNFKDLTEVGIRQAPLNVRGPNSGYKIPVKQSFVFSGDTQVAVLNTPYELNKSKGIFRTVIDAGNNSYRLTEFQKDVDTESFENDIETGTWLNNSKIAVKPQGEGLESISIDSTNLLRNYTTFDSTDYSVEENTIYGETLKNSVEMYNGSSELIIESENRNNHLMKNFTDLYWSNGSDTLTLSGRGDFRSGKTEGLVLHGLNGNDYGVVWTGLSDVNVSKPDNKTVNVSMEGNYTYNLRAYEGRLQEGKDRIKFARKGNIVVGAKNEFEAVSIPEMNKISGWPDFKTENELGISNVGYNITYGQFISKKDSSSTASQEEWNEGSFNGTSADTKGNSNMLSIGYLNGTQSGQENTNGLNNQSLFGHWRFDSSVDPLPGSTNVKDYSGNGRNGTFENEDDDERGKKGVFSTDGLEFDGENDFVSVDKNYSPNSFSAGAWIKPDEPSDDFQGIVSNDNGGALSDGWRIDNQDNKFRFIFQTDSTQKIEGGTYDESWHHVFVTFRDGENAKIYVDGEEKDSQSVGNIDYSDIEEKIALGAHANGNSNLNGTLDEVRIYNRSLSKDEVKSLYFFGSDGEFNGNYTTETIENSLKVQWQRLKADISGIDSETALKVDFIALGEDDKEKKTETFTLNDGTNEKILNVPDTEKARLVFYGKTENVTKTWEVDDFNVTYSDNKRGRVEKGLNIPFQNVEISSETFPMVESDGDVETLKNQIAVWR